MYNKITEIKLADLLAVLLKHSQPSEFCCEKHGGVCSVFLSCTLGTHTTSYSLVEVIINCDLAPSFSIEP